MELYTTLWRIKTSLAFRLGQALKMSRLVRLFMWALIGSVVVLCPFYLFVTSSSPVPHITSHAASTGCNSNPDARNPAQVVIYAKPNTGSTFITQFFTQRSDVFLISEPAELLSRQEVPQRVKYVVSCQLQGVWNKTQKLIKRKHNEVSRYKNDMSVIEVKRKLFCLDSTDLEQCLSRDICSIERQCYSATAAVARCLHVPKLSMLEYIMKDNVKVIFLIRDPRGVFHSHIMHDMKLKLNREPTQTELISHFNSKSSLYLKDIKYYCSVLTGDIATVRRLRGTWTDGQKPLVLVRYEDASRDPLAQMTRMYKAAGLNQSLSVYNWINDLTHPEQTDVGDNQPNEDQEEPLEAAETPVGESTDQSTRWRNLMPFSAVKSVQDHCWSVMDTFGYILIHSEQELSDSSVPLVTSPGHDLFHL